MSERSKTRSLPITKEMVWAAYKKVKSNRGSAGVDRVSLESFEMDLGRNLYKIWNRLSSGSYFPPPLREVTIPKRDGKTRGLGIPTVGDRIAQQVIKSYLEPSLDKLFHQDSYGYRPNKSAHQALTKVRNNVRQYAWVLDMDIRSFFDEVSHELLMKALARHVSESWVKMYVLRWLETPVEKTTGERIPKQGKGTPQGGVISPLLANLYLHYTLDKWLANNYPTIRFVRYADDTIIHCSTEEEANSMLKAVQGRLAECGLCLNEQKTKIVYCQDYRRARRKDCKKQFNFLGFSFQPVWNKSNRVGMFLGYNCVMSPSSRKRVNAEIKSTRFHRWTTATIEDIAEMLNPKLIGWTNYYGKFSRDKLSRVFHQFHWRLVKWLMNKYKSLRRSLNKAFDYLKKLHRTKPNLFYHWTKGYRL